MHKFIRMWALVAVLIGTAASASAATPSEFYLGLLRRGTAAYDASRYADAQKQLRIAAFGLVEAIEQYQVAQVYLTLTYDKLSDADRAREAAHRVFLAERVERKYAALPLPAEVRKAFETTANKLMNASESGMLLRGAPMPPPTAPAAQRTTASTQPPPAATPRRTTTTVAQTKPQPPQTSATQPAQSQPRNTIPEPRNTTPENAPPQTPAQSTTQSAAPAPQPEKPRTTTPAQTAAVQPAKPQPAKPAPATTAATTPATKPAGTEPDGRGGPVEPPARAAATPAAPRPLTANEVVSRMAAADRGLGTGNLAEARRAYRELLGAPGLDHETLIRVAEGLYRARDFSSALNAFTRVGTLRRGEEPYRYYIAVAAYETGDFARAKKELAAALPFIEVTPDVARYRTKIEGSM